ncbi:MAG: bifunctional diguanylate cyclase/phosphodiesterase [Clostridia bacterium]|nr:bifunctional diguanylate cyclase/phosphodiesterase [Clostridia bacterium]
MQEKRTDKNSAVRNNPSLDKFTERFLNVQNDEPGKISIRIALVYLLAGIAWILLSDKILGFVARDKEVMTTVSMIKGWMYVVVSGLLIFFLVYSALKRIQSAEQELVVSYQNLTAVNEELEAANEQLAASEVELRRQYEQVIKNQQMLRESEAKLQHLAFFDQLTGLMNRISLKERLQKLIQHNHAEKLALILIDIDNFKYVNDTMGHSFGDQLIVRISEKLEAIAGEDCTVYRQGGDEFIVLLESLKSIEEIERLAVKILKEFKQTIEIGSSSLYTTASLGISIYPDHGITVDELLKSADIAVYKAKAAGRNRIVFYNEPMHTAVVERMRIEKNLHSALEKNEFELYYQPQLEISTKRISGFEALLRWKNSELGFVSPDKFIPVAEDTQLIIPIGEWVLRNACAFLKRLGKQDHGDLTMSVNISMLQLMQENFVDTVMDALSSANISPRQLEIEITESILMESYEIIAGKLKLLRGYGIRIALDDFGKGYSSLNYLKQLPISTLKIDKSFIDTILTDDKNKSLTSFIVKIGRSLDLCVVAEGVETQEQMDYLIKHKCNKIQGYLFSKPISEAEVLEQLKE